MCLSTDIGTPVGLNAAERTRLAGTLRERGLRLTTQREMVYEVITACPGHICAEHILAAVSVRRPNLQLNKTTVYRALDLLKELGMVTEHRCGGGPAQYEPASRGSHSHLLCRGCGKLLDMDQRMAAALREGLRAQHGFQADLESYPLSGLCRSCRG